MQTFSFEALGTVWSIAIDAEVIDPSLPVAVADLIEGCSARFSRFRENTEVVQFREAKAGRYPISAEFAVLLERADHIRMLTQGAYDPAIGGLLERAGYDSRYSFQSSQDVRQFQLPKWELHEREIEIDGPVVFDIGGIGKGYVIDLVAKYLQEKGNRYFLVEAGGDMYGTTKANNSPWNIALEWPGRPDMAAGVLPLRNQGFAASDRFRRKWGNWHHIVDPEKKAPVMGVLGCAAVAGNAFDADSLTSYLFLVPEEEQSSQGGPCKGEYVVFGADGHVRVSSHWSGELFTEEKAS